MDRGFGRSPHAKGPSANRASLLEVSQIERFDSRSGAAVGRHTHRERRRQRSIDRALDQRFARPLDRPEKRAATAERLGGPARLCSPRRLSLSETPSRSADRNQNVPDRGGGRPERPDAVRTRTGVTTGVSAGNCPMWLADGDGKRRPVRSLVSHSRVKPSLVRLSGLVGAKSHGGRNSAAGTSPVKTRFMIMPPDAGDCRIAFPTSLEARDRLRFAKRPARACPRVAICTITCEDRCVFRHNALTLLKIIWTKDPATAADRQRTLASFSGLFGSPFLQLAPSLTGLSGIEEASL
jgi:hypothetical protein